MRGGDEKKCWVIEKTKKNPLDLVIIFANFLQKDAEGLFKHQKSGKNK